jgi:hypothetical protein
VDRFFAQGCPMLRADVAQRRYTAAMDFVEVSTDILVTSIEGVFSAMRDLVFNGAGMDDPKAKEKLDHSEKVMTRRCVSPCRSTS